MRKNNDHPGLSDNQKTDKTQLELTFMIDERRTLQRLVNNLCNCQFAQQCSNYQRLGM